MWRGFAEGGNAQETCPAQELPRGDLECGAENLSTHEFRHDENISRAGSVRLLCWIVEWWQRGAGAVMGK